MSPRSLSDSEGLKVSHSVDGLCGEHQVRLLFVPQVRKWPLIGQAALLLGSDWLWSPSPDWSRSMVTPHYYQEFSCHSLSKHKAACLTIQIIIRPYKYLFSSSLPLSFSHKLTVYKLSCQNNFSDVQEIKNSEIYFQIAVWVIAGRGVEAKARRSVIRRESCSISWSLNWSGSKRTKEKANLDQQDWQLMIISIHSCCMRMWGITWMSQGSLKVGVVSVVDCNECC